MFIVFPPRRNVASHLPVGRVDQRQPVGRRALVLMSPRGDGRGEVSGGHHRSGLPSRKKPLLGPSSGDDGLWNLDGKWVYLHVDSSFGVDAA